MTQRLGTQRTGPNAGPQWRLGAGTGAVLPVLFGTHAVAASALYPYAAVAAASTYYPTVVQGVVGVGAAGAALAAGQALAGAAPHRPTPFR